MGRRWVVVVEWLNGEPLFLRRHKTLPGKHGRPQVERLPVTIPYATKFVTKREALTLARRRGWKTPVARRTWW